MMRKIFIYSGLFLSLLSCGSEEKKLAEAPQNLISKSTFKEIMIDIHLLEASQKLSLLKEMKNDSIRIDAYYQQIFDKYQIDLENFKSSHDYYSSDKKAFLKFYEELSKELQEAETQLKK